MKFITNHINFLSLGLLFSVSWLLFWFLFNPHAIELANTIDSWFMFNGFIFYKQIPSFHFPLGRVVLLIGHLATNFDLRFGPFLALSLSLLTLIAIFFIGKRYLSPSANAFSLIFFGLFFWVGSSSISYTHEALIGFLLSLTLLLFFKFLSQKKTNFKIYFLLGLLISLTELTGQIVSVSLLIISLITIYYIYSKSSSKFSSLLFFFLGILIPFFITVIYFTANKAISDFIYYNFTFYIYYANSKQRDFYNLPFMQLSEFYFALLTTPFLLIYSYFRKIHTSKFILLLVILSLSTIPFTVFSIYHPHHLLYGLAINALLFGSLVDIVPHPSKAIRILLTILILLFVLLAYKDIFLWHYSRFQSPSMRITNDTSPGDGMYESIQWIKSNTKSSDKILVIGDPLFYIRSNRLPSVRASEGLPYMWQPFDQVKKQIMEAKIDYWITDSKYTNRLIKNYDEPQMYYFIQKTLHDCYIRVYLADTWEIWQNRCLN